MANSPFQKGTSTSFTAISSNVHHVHPSSFSQSVKKCCTDRVRPILVTCWAHPQHHHPAYRPPGRFSPLSRFPTFLSSCFVATFNVNNHRDQKELQWGISQVYQVNQVLIYKGISQVYIYIYQVYIYIYHQVYISGTSDLPEGITSLYQVNLQEFSETWWSWKISFRCMMPPWAHGKWIHPSPARNIQIKHDCFGSPSFWGSNCHVYLFPSVHVPWVFRAQVQQKGTAPFLGSDNVSIRLCRAKGRESISNEDANTSRKSSIPRRNRSYRSLMEGGEIYSIGFRFWVQTLKKKRIENAWSSLFIDSFLKFIS